MPANCVLCGKDLEPIAETLGATMREVEFIHLATAHRPLMAAAPDLLAALRGMLLVQEMNAEDACRAIHAAGLAIAKAEGK